MDVLICRYGVSAPNTFPVSSESSDFRKAEKEENESQNDGHKKRNEGSKEARKGRERITIASKVRRAELNELISSFSFQAGVLQISNAMLERWCVICGRCARGSCPICQPLTQVQLLDLLMLGVRHTEPAFRSVFYCSEHCGSNE